MPPSAVQSVCLSRCVYEGAVLADFQGSRVASRIQDPSLVLKKDMERFLWNFLALRTSSGPAVGADGETAAPTLLA